MKKSNKSVRKISILYATNELCYSNVDKKKPARREVGQEIGLPANVSEIAVKAFCSAVA